MADHQGKDAAPEHVLGGPTPTPPPWTPRDEKAYRLKRLLTWTALIVGLGLCLYLYALITPDGPTGAARTRDNCQFQYSNDKAAVAACVKAKGG